MDTSVTDFITAVGAWGTGTEDMSVWGGSGPGPRGAPRSAGREQEAAGEGPGCSGAAHTPARVCPWLLHTSCPGWFVWNLLTNHVKYFVTSIIKKISFYKENRTHVLFCLFLCFVFLWLSPLVGSAETEQPTRGREIGNCPAQLEESSRG